MALQYFILSLTLLGICFIISLIFSKLLHVKVFGGIVVMTIVATIGAVFGIYYFPLINELVYSNIQLSDAIAGAFILIIILYIATPKSLK